MKNKADDVIDLHEFASESIWHFTDSGEAIWQMLTLNTTPILTLILVLTLTLA